MSTSGTFLAAAILAFGRPPELRRADPETPPPLATWTDLCDRPVEWLGRTARIPVQWSGRVETWNPYLTRFGAREFAAIQGWTDEQFPWIRDEYDAPAVRVFFRRGGACDWALEGAKRGARYELTVVVREMFLDLPWAEVVEVRPLAERISEGTAIHAGKARELMIARNYVLAQSELEQAITDDLPAVARKELEHMLGLCRDAIALEKSSKKPIEPRR